MEESFLPTSELLTHLRSWEGRCETQHDEITAAPMRNLSATLDRDDPAPAPGTELPPLWHWLYFLPNVQQSAIAPDGHARKGTFLPPIPLPRRMWAGGRLEWHRPLRLGEAVRRTSRITSVTYKQGSTGALFFVLVKHELFNEQGLALTEEHDIVYRSATTASGSAAVPRKSPSSSAWSREIVPDDVLLFRYSALTFNGHRIHYDRRYAQDVEGYPGLIVHGPLIATLLVDLVRRNCPQAKLRSFSFKALRPTFDLHPFFIHGLPETNGATIKLWAHGHEGWLTMEAEARLA
ncbi:MAG: MaoC family dehydratase N-terminal domain-containing protein [Burkholderiaceae bacterium]